MRNTLSCGRRLERKYIPQEGEGDEIKVLEPFIFNMEIRKALDKRDEKELRLEENQETEVSRSLGKA